MHKATDTADHYPLSRGVAQSGVRITNERAVLTLIACSPGSSNADVARLSGLGPQTTSRIIAELESRGLIIRGEVLRGRRGQPATPLFLNPHGAVAIGIEIGWRHFEVMVVEMSGKTLASVRSSYAWPDARSIFSDIAAEVATIRSGLSDLQQIRLAGIGLASPSHIGRNIGLLNAPEEQAALWRDIDLADRIAKDTGLPVQWFNDGNAACWSEVISLSMRRSYGYAYFQIGSLVAGGLVTNGELWEGNGRAANLGSILVCDDQGKPTFVHMIASIIALERLLARAGIAVPAGSPFNWDWDELEPVATQWLDNAGLALAKAVVNTNAVLELNKAIIDGVMPRAIIARLLECVERHLAGLPTLAAGHPALEMGLLGGLRSGHRRGAALAVPALFFAGLEAVFHLMACN
ncbi:MAG: ROK family transcriptional regulator [Candidatus Devosia euplotis]|nr:ROK family transcriptional regulator [Candidatus Devosia euplotis]